MKKLSDYTDYKFASGIYLGLSRIETLLRELGNPEKEIKFIHVGGTNGKGSVCSFLGSILSEAGYKVGRFSSPAVFDFREQIRISELKYVEDIEEKTYISEEDMKNYAAKVKAACVKIEKEHGLKPSEFEFITALCFLYFKEKYVDFAIIEVGLGGKNDATNVITPILSILSSISEDHLGVIGNNLTEIAEEKSGIIKKGVPLVTYPQKEEVREVIFRVCHEKNSEIFELDFSNIRINELDLSMPYKLTFLYSGLLYKLPYTAIYQVFNSVLAIKAIEVLNFYYSLEIDYKFMTNAVYNTKIKGRFEKISDSPFVIVDGAHNPDAAKQLSKTLSLSYSNSSSLIGIFAVMKDKDIRGILSQVIKHFDEFIIYKPKIKRAAEIQEIVKILDELKYCGKINYTDSISELISSMIERNNNVASSKFIAFGSLYYLKELKEELYENIARG